MLINSIFHSINGECSLQHQGSLCTFIRFSMCNLQCRWCDTKYSQDKKNSKEMSIKSVINKISSYGYKNIVITGGEPLHQQDELLFLLEALNKKDYSVSIETNGSYEIPYIGNYNVSWVADWKCASSGMSQYMNIDNLKNLTHVDFLKFVIADKQDFLEALEVIKIMSVQKVHPKFVMSPTNRESSKELIAWMKGEKILRKTGAIFSLQIHKLLNID